MKWQTKLVLDSAKALLPFQSKLRQAKRRLLGCETEPDKDAKALSDGIGQIEWLLAAGCPLRGTHVLEIGTGWQPIIPLVYYLAGCSKIYLTDTTVLLDSSLILNAIRVVKDSASTIFHRLGISESEVEARLTIDASHSAVELLTRLGMKYLAPCDTRRLGLRSACLDVICSRAVLEHISPQVLRSILFECVRLLKPGGMTIHDVDHSDHWEHNDKSISRVNFLKFSDPLWFLCGTNRLNYQNRLRHFEYVSFLREAGLRILREEKRIDQDSVVALRMMKLAKRFRGMPNEELAVVESRLLAARD